MADLLYIVTRSKLSSGAPLKTYSEIVQQTKQPVDKRTEDQIAQGIIDRLRGRK